MLLFDTAGSRFRPYPSFAGKELFEDHGVQGQFRQTIYSNIAFMYRNSDI
jgi:hypothetical protein